MEALKVQRKKRKIFLLVGAVLYTIFLAIPIVLLIPGIRCYLNLGEPAIIATVINGITAPLLSFIAIWVTFEAFWVQYESNINQLNISEEQRKSGENQICDLKKERFENRFFSYINLIHEQEKDTIIPHVGSSKQAYHFMFYEFKAICYLVITFGAYENLNNRRILELTQAFFLFINGVSSSSVSRLTENSKDVDIEEVKRMNAFLLAQQAYYINSGKMPKYLKDYHNDGIKLFDGHRLHLVSFYRAFCMTLQYLYKAMDENVVVDYVLYRNILLAQFSEHQIALLRIMYLYGKDENLMFIQKRYKKRVRKFFTKTMKNYIKSKTMNSEDEGFIDL